ncbi:hypothetical protein [Mycobacterium paraense]|uniref:hypothetical protein n=1 Tax=Mycobacterium paraense TaxID=767916 RepID=UPI00114EF943|nr:hypothetical protein [Mycobacterium paraense]
MSADPSLDYNELLHDQAHARDILYHFCCDAFYLSEWIGKSRLRRNNIQVDLSRLLNRRGTGTSAALSACADIANASKHFKLTQSSYTTGRRRGHARAVAHTQGARLPFRFPVHFGANYFTIEVRGVQRDALDVARDAVADWDTWLKSHGVRLPT